MGVRIKYMGMGIKTYFRILNVFIYSLHQLKFHSRILSYQLQACLIVIIVKQATVSVLRLRFCSVQRICLLCYV